MPSAEFRFYAELNDFLAPERRFIAVKFEFAAAPSVKDAIESFGVPHTEVDLIAVNSEPAGFDYVLRDRDRVAVYPVFEAFDIRSTGRVRPEPLRETRFILDVHLGRLAAYLRMLGFDSFYRNDAMDDELARISSEERRILLTRDRGLLKRSAVTHGYCLRATNSREQLAEVVRRFDLTSSVRPFTRCLRCNEELRTAEREAVAGRAPDPVLARQTRFLECGGCGRLYWPGSHYARMQALVEEITRPNTGSTARPRSGPG